MSAKNQAVRRVLIGAAAVALLAAPSAVLNQTAEPNTRTEARPCIDGVVPGNPYIPNCALPRRGPKVRGAAPDANAIIACRGIPGCLSWYVNGPY